MIGLVYIGKVIDISQIEGADRIESICVVCGKGGKWQGTAQKGQFEIGDLCQVYLQDSILPSSPEFAFMEKYHYRVRMCKFKGVPSECLIMPLNRRDLSIGDDITEIVGVEKYYKPIPPNMSGLVYGDFPAFIPKTDEPNFQKVLDMVEMLSGKRFYSTVKADGSSATVYLKDGHFGCCSRNLELRETEGNAIWKLARKYCLEDVLKVNIAFECALQFEVVGPGIQGNKMGLKQVDARLFNVYNIEKQQYKNGETVKMFAENIGMPMVDIMDWDVPFDFQSDDELRKYAEGIYPNGNQMEGAVIRPMDEIIIEGNRLSFKVLNLLYGQ